MPEKVRVPRTAPPNFTDHKIITHGGAELSARIWLADPLPTNPAPFVVWTHGGGWLTGNHFAPTSWLLPGFRQRGYHLISHSYRLGPQANLDDQLADCLDIISWCRESLPAIMGKGRIDLDRYVICGESAGAHLVMLMAHHLSPPPKAVIDVSGIVDLASVYPILHYRPSSDREAPPWDGAIPEEQLDASLADRDPANTLTETLFWNEDMHFSEELLSKCWATEFRYTPRILLQAELHRWRSELPERMSAGIKSLRKGTIHDERFADEEAVKDYLSSMSALLLLNGKSWYPPTAFLHGTGDTAALLDQSQSMAKRLKELNVPVIECYEPNEPHGFDNKYTSPHIAGWDIYIQPILDFCDHHVGPCPD